MTKTSDLAPIPSPTEDLRFKKMLTTPGHLGVAQGFIKDFFGIEVPLSGIRIANGYDITQVRRAVNEGDRAVRKLAETMRDVAFEVDVASLTVEMQIRTTPVMPIREGFYISSAFIKGYGHDPSDPYRSLKPVAALSILDHVRFDDDIAYRYESLGDFAGPGYYVPPRYEVQPMFWRGIFELPKFPTYPDHVSWRRGFREGIALKQDPEYVQEGVELIRYIDLEPEEQEMIDIMEKVRADQLTELAERRREDEQRRREDEQRRLEDAEWQRKESQWQQQETQLRDEIARLQSELAGLVSSDE